METSDKSPVADGGGQPLAPPMGSTAELPEAWIRLAAARSRAAIRERAKLRKRAFAWVAGAVILVIVSVAAIYGVPKWMEIMNQSEHGATRR